MPVVSRATPRGVAEAQWVAWPPIDTLYDPVAFLEASPGGRIAELPPERWGTEVAIVGAGVAGLLAAHELLRIGARPVIFEASERVGGRCWSQPFTDLVAGRRVPSPTDFAELGAMRFPPSGRLFMRYARDIFGLSFAGAFPDPGRVLTLLGYENGVVAWQPGDPPPGDFTAIKRDFDNFMNLLIAPLYAAWQAGDLAETRRVWQSYLDRFKDLSFYAALRQGIPAWTDEDLNRFGALGMGSGGFGSLYEVSFLEMLRIAVNMYEEDQLLLADGTAAFAARFHTTPVRLPDGRELSLAAAGVVRLRHTVTGISRGPGGDPVVAYRDAAGRAQSASFRAVIVATTIRAMQAMGLTLPSPREPGDVVAEPVKVAMRNLHMENSSKLFIRTATKFWRPRPGEPATIPQNIQLDDLPRGVYALDYPHTERGIVLISYTWGDDSVRLLALPPAERFSLFKEAIRRVSPAFAAHLVPLYDEIITVDWECQPYAFGAFKLQYPGQEVDQAAVYYQFLSVRGPADRGVYLAGDSVSWTGGWIEGACQTGLNAACAAAERIGATVCELAPSPLTQNPALYHYGSRARAG